MRIHLGHHFYGAGNLGDDFMLAGFLRAMGSLAPAARYTCAVPFPLDPLRRRFPKIEWFTYDASSRERCIAECDVWLGLGGSPFQSAQSRWFLDHLIADAALCRRHAKRMYFLGVGVQTEQELGAPELRAVIDQAAAIWTRDDVSAERVRSIASDKPVEAVADVAHVLFDAIQPPNPRYSRFTVVPNFDYQHWLGLPAFLSAVNEVQPNERIWLAQESRNLPGAECALFEMLSEYEQRQWQLVCPDTPGTAITEAIASWPTGEWLVTARYHAAIVGAWSGSKVVVIETNEKLRAIARELGVPTISPDATTGEVLTALRLSRVLERPAAQAGRAIRACAAFVTAARSLG